MLVSLAKVIIRPVQLQSLLHILRGKLVSKIGYDCSTFWDVQSRSLKKHPSHHEVRKKLFSFARCCTWHIMGWSISLRSIGWLWMPIPLPVIPTIPVSPTRSGPGIMVLTGLLIGILFIFIQSTIITKGTWCSRSGCGVQVLRCEGSTLLRCDLRVTHSILFNRLSQCPPSFEQCFIVPHRPCAHWFTFSSTYLIEELADHLSSFSQCRSLNLRLQKVQQLDCTSVVTHPPRHLVLDWSSCRSFKRRLKSWPS